MEEKIIYVVIPATVQSARNVIQPPGRQIAQACHVVSKLRHEQKPTNGYVKGFSDALEPITTIILQARDSLELNHVCYLLLRNNLVPVIFEDNNKDYGYGSAVTALAVFATKTDVIGILDYLPAWGKHEL